MLSINCNGRLLSFHHPMAMGIINVTPDSFFSGSRNMQVGEIVKTVEQMILDGVTIIDVGGQSTRPGSQRINSDDELNRVMPAIEAIVKAFPSCIVSVDTFYSKVARHAVEAGAGMVNDVSAGSIDEALIPTVAELKVPYVLMHMQGDPQTMQDNPVYNNVVLDVFDFLNFKIKQLQQAGINDIIIDPGFGFGKTIQHNFQLLAGLSFFKQLDKPVMVGLSRKTTIYKTLDITADKALNGTTVLHTISLLNGANILRVHDVKEAMEAVRLVSAYKKSSIELL